SRYRTRRRRGLTGAQSACAVIRARSKTAATGRSDPGTPSTCPEVFDRAIPSAKIEPAITYGFGNVRGGQLLCIDEIGDGARDLQDAMVGERRERELRESVPPQGLPLHVGCAPSLDFPSVEVSVRLALPLVLARRGTTHAIADLRGRLAIPLACAR